MLLDSTNHKEITPYNEYPYLLYGRVSTEKDEQVSSLENQVDICRNWLEKNGYEWNEKAIVLDNGISGTVLFDRDAMQLVLEKSRKREIKMVIFKSIHRLARDMKDSLEIKETLLAHGVRLVTIEEGYDSLYEGKNDMKFEMFSMFAAQYPKTLSVSISGVLSAKVRRGEHVGPVPFGYSKPDKKLVINEEEAQTVRQMFHWYNHDGFGFKTITKLLNEELVKGNVSKPQKKDKWQVTSVQSIIKNPTYTGTYIRNRYTKIKVNGRKKQIENPREVWQIYKDHHPAIISMDEWEKANNKNISNNKTKISPWNEFRGMLKCSECGSNMVILQTGNKKTKDGQKDDHWKYIKCSAYRRAGEFGCVNHKPILYEDLREFVLKKIIRKGKRLKLNLENNFLQQRKKEIASMEKQIASLEEMNKGLIDLHLKDKLITKAEFQMKRTEYEKEISSLKDKVFLMKQEEDHQIDIQNIQEAFNQLERHDEDLYHAFSTIIDHIVVHPDGKLDFYYKFKA
ncbi:recombinase family protein [Heyndrickxia ginsengihumi]|uniref:recombinase family protein n=1 Tax=Heyndrickxia ginsengihumi TaxID=363870 RepID=UPI000470C3E8|nr:recombinase family protein [Heyndrickxia ginsengihumi]